MSDERKRGALSPRGLLVICLIAFVCADNAPAENAGEAERRGKRVTITVKFDPIKPCADRGRDDPSEGIFADVHLDGKVIGSIENRSGTGSASFSIDAGMHTVWVLSRGYESDTKEDMHIQEHSSDPQEFGFHLRRREAIHIELLRTTDIARADRLLERLQAAGEPARRIFLQPMPVGQKDIAMVQLGPYGNCAMAERAAELWSEVVYEQKR